MRILIKSKIKVCNKSFGLLLSIFILLYFGNTLYAQHPTKVGASSDKDDFTNESGWSFTIDDSNSKPPGQGFMWWKNGGNNQSDLMMQLLENTGLLLSGKLIDLGYNKPDREENAGKITYEAIANDYSTTNVRGYFFRKTIKNVFV